jgi:hypothetical protein
VTSQLLFYAAGYSKLTGEYFPSATWPARDAADFSIVLVRIKREDEDWSSLKMMWDGTKRIIFFSLAATEG